MINDRLKKYLPIFVAGGMAIIVAGYYLISGRGSLDNNLRQLEKSAPVEKVETTDNNSVVVRCKNGESYEIVYEQGQTNYQDLVYDKCGEAGQAGETGATEQVQ